MDIAQVLTVKFADSEWKLNGNDYETLEWLSETSKPTKKQLEDLWANVQAEADAKIAARESALAKLAALGLTQDEIDAL